MNEPVNTQQTRSRMVEVPGQAGAPTNRSCARCNSVVGLEDLFCHRCGASLVSQAEAEQGHPSGTEAAMGPTAEAETKETPSQAAQPACPRVEATAADEPAPARTACACGRDLASDARFCDRCGTKIASAEPQYQLIGLSPEIKGLCVRVGDDEVFIGKTPESGLSLDHDHYASRRHARVFRSDGKVFLEDLGSSNGTFLRIRAAVALEPGDEIAIGTSVLRLVSIDSAGKVKEPS